MGTYVIEETPAFKERVDSELSSIVGQILEHPDAGRFIAIVLMGGYGRGEGTPLQEDGEQVPFNDYDLVVVTQPLSRSERQALQGRLHPLEAELSDQVGIAVDIALMPVNTLKNAEFSLMNFEMKGGHRVLWGDAKILDLMPDYKVDDLPLIEGTRLLLNRGYLLWENVERFKYDDPLTSYEANTALKYLWKVHLAFGDCIMMVYRQYDICYGVKKERFEKVMQEEDFPNPSWIGEQYFKAIEFKHHGDPKLYPHSDLQQLQEETRELFTPFLLWFESHRLKKNISSLEEYADPVLLEGGDPSPTWKRIALNLLILHGGAIAPSWRWLLLHPRHRLFVALPLLLKFSLTEKEQTLLEKLLQARGEEIGPQFHRLRGRLA